MACPREQQLRLHNRNRLHYNASSATYCQHQCRVLQANELTDGNFTPPPHQFGYDKLDGKSWLMSYGGSGCRTGGIAFGYPIVGRTARVLVYVLYILKSMPTTELARSSSKWFSKVIAVNQPEEI